MLILLPSLKVIVLFNYFSSLFFCCSIPLFSPSVRPFVRSHRLSEKFHPERINLLGLNSFLIVRNWLSDILLKFFETGCPKYISWTFVSWWLETNCPNFFGHYFCDCLKLIFRDCSKASVRTFFVFVRKISSVFQQWLFEHLF